MKRVVVFMLFVLALPTVRAQVTGPVPLTGTVQVISGGPGAQTDPHISGSRVSYTSFTDTGVRIHVFDFATGQDTRLGHDDGFWDRVSDVSGDYVVFTRGDTSGTHEIAFVNLSDPTLTPRILASDPAVRRNVGRVGGDTVAFQQSTTGNSSVSAVCVASLSSPSDPALCLTSEEFSNSNPAVSPDGNTVVFQRCATPNTNCDIYAAQRHTDGTWGDPVAITSGGGNHVSPDTNGTIVVYSSDAAAVGDFDVYYEPVTGTGPATRLELTDAPGSDEENPSISGTLITLERTLPGEINADIYLFDIATNRLAMLPATPDIDELLNDVSTTPDGTVRVVWTATDPLNPLDGRNIYAFTFSLYGPSYLVCPLFDTSRSFKAGRVAPLRIQLCDGDGANLSSSELVVTAIGLVQRDTTAAPVLAAESPGEANADGVFRYDATLGGYVFNLSTHGLAAGTWELQFRVSGEAAVYAIPFDVK